MSAICIWFNRIWIAFYMCLSQRDPYAVHGGAPSTSIDRMPMAKALSVAIDGRSANSKNVDAVFWWIRMREFKAYRFARRVGSGTTIECVIFRSSQHRSHSFASIQCDAFLATSPYIILMWIVQWIWHYGRWMHKHIPIYILYAKRFRSKSRSHHKIYCRFFFAEHVHREGEHIAEFACSVHRNCQSQTVSLAAKQGHDQVEGICA